MRLIARQKLPADDNYDNENWFKEIIINFRDNREM